MNPNDQEETRYLIVKLVLKGSGKNRYYLWEPINPEEVHIQTIEEAEPMKHAHWIPSESETGEGSNTYKCSVCGEIQMLIEGTPRENGWKYCPNCGAMMLRGEQDE